MSDHTYQPATDSPYGQVYGQWLFRTPEARAELLRSLDPDALDEYGQLADMALNTPVFENDIDLSAWRTALRAESERRDAEHLAAEPPAYDDRMPSAFGLAVDAAADRPRSVIAPPEVTASGNVVLRVGHELAVGRGWQQSEHVVLTPEEARALASQIAGAAA